MRIGVVIPLFKQSEYLIECVTSALDQTLQATGIVIINDGCPNPSSDTLSRTLAAAWPERLLYVRQQNGGLSSARNRGVRELLARWPQIEAIFPLDADNWLDTRALEMMAAHLASDDRLDWVYPDMQRFGGDFIDSKPWPRLSPFRLIFRNQCDAGCLIRRRVFDAGFLYDETMRQGFEDWEFFLRAALRGFRGGSAASAGFYYRVRKASMLTEAMKEFEAVKRSLYDRHPGILEPWNLVACEHKYMPRFRFIDEALTVRDFSDPQQAPAWNQALDPGYAPPITIVGSSAAFDLLSRTGTLRGLLLFIQHEARTRTLVIGFENGRAGIYFDRKKGFTDAPPLLAFQTKWLNEGIISSDSIESTIGGADGLIVGGGDYTLSPQERVDFRPLLHHARALASNEAVKDEGPLEWRALSNSWFAGWHQLESDPVEIVYPLAVAQDINVCFVVPCLRSDRSSQCVVGVAEAIRRLNKNLRIHLLVTEAGTIDLAEGPHAFDEIVSVAHCEREHQLSMTANVLGSMDVIINAHSEVGYGALPLLRRRTRAIHRPVYIAYLHQPAGTTENEIAAGSPHIACGYENEIDAFLVMSDELRDFVSNCGVNEERIQVARHAPIIRLPTREQALLLADQKATRQVERSCPLELLLVGRVDSEIDMSRLGQFIQRAEQADINLRLTMIGSAVVGGRKVDWPWSSDQVRLVEPTADRATLARCLERADGAMSLSEDVPLALLDAMAHGCIVVAADSSPVGALVVDGVNGLLYPSSGSDDAIAGAALKQIKTVLADRTGCRELRERAVDTAMRFTWDQVASVLEGFLAAAAQSRSNLRAGPEGGGVWG